MLLDRGKEMSRCIALGEDHGLTAKGAHLCTADIEYVAQVCKLREGDIGLVTGKSVSKTGSVYKQRNAVLPAYTVYIGKFLSGIDCSIFRWE